VSVDVAFIFVRALSLIAMFQAAGVALFLARFEDRLRSSSRAIRQLGLWSALLGLLLVLVHHGLEAPRMTGDFADLWDRALQTQVLHSSIGAANATRAAALVIIAATLALPGTASVPWSIVGSGLMAAAFLLTGHTTTHSPHWALASLLWAHLTIVMFWFGALPSLLLVARRESSALAGGVVAAFSRIAAWLVPFIAVAGAGLALLLLPGVEALRQPYGIILLVKSATFILLMMLAALNKWRLGPRVATGDTRSLRILRRSVAAEYVLIVGVLVLTAALTTLYSPEP